MNPDDYFPKIESASDSYGNKIENAYYGASNQSQTIVREGDTVEFHCKAKDPTGAGLEYSVARIGEKNWVENKNGSIKFERKDIGKMFDIQIMIRSKNDYHAYGEYDDYVQFRYVVLPKEIEK